ncbi:MAG: hypothetical protein JJU06_14415 [Ectothiorhodospiraceae bacterium]|nr:hypothetical protein [Ectothiorhodospiraceae bacterium]
MIKKAKIHQHSDLTFRHNVGLWRHGWLRLTPAYSVKVVDEIISASDAERILDPFSGTATTPLCAADLGRMGVSVDINPFLVWLGNVKLAHYATESLTRAEAAFDRVCVEAVSTASRKVNPPPLHNIERWWSESALDFLCRMKAAIDDSCDAGTPENDLMRVIFCRTLIAISNAAFNHQSMSFKDASEDEKFIAEDYRRISLGFSKEILESAAQNPSGSGEVWLGDSRQMSCDKDQLFDMVVTSPPYANRMSYIRELRPYMYWLGYLYESREAGELDWQAIGGTWGVATSKVAEWMPPKDFRIPSKLSAIATEIEGAHPKNGRTLSRYVVKYFFDMAKHIESIKSVLRPGAEVHYVVGNSTFYGHLVSTEAVYAELLENEGFSSVDVRILRKRNSKKELFEFVVSARAPASAGKGSGSQSEASLAVAAGS